MSVEAAVAPTVPAARSWRARVRRARRAHHHRRLSDVLTDLYALFWAFLISGVALTAEVRRRLNAPLEAAVPPEDYWIGAAALLVGAGLAWQALRTLGPLLATPAEQAWGVSTPVDRRGWLIPRFGWLLLGGGLGGLVSAVGATALGVHTLSVGWAALAGFLWGVTAAGLAVVVQRAPRERRWPRLPGAALLGGGAVTAAVLVAAYNKGSTIPRPDAPVAAIMAVVGLVPAVLAVVAAVRALPHLAVSRLSAGADVAGAAFTSAVSLDPSLLASVLEIRRWRRVGRVRSRSFRLGGLGLPSRPWGLVQADLIRLTRRPLPLWTWGALALTQFVVAITAPSAAGAVHVLAGYAVATRFMGGLRALSRSPGLRRALGGGELGLRLAHVAVPAYATAFWWALTWSAAAPQAIGLELLLTAGVVAAAYRAATRPPMTYGGFVVDTPFGLVPVELIMQLARGPDLLALVLLVRILFGG